MLCSSLSLAQSPVRAHCTVSGNHSLSFFSKGGQLSATATEAAGAQLAQTSKLKGKKSASKTYKCGQQKKTKSQE